VAISDVQAALANLVVTKTDVATVVFDSVSTVSSQLSWSGSNPIVATYTFSIPAGDITGSAISFFITSTAGLQGPPLNGTIVAYDATNVIISVGGTTPAFYMVATPPSEAPGGITLSAGGSDAEDFPITDFGTSGPYTPPSPVCFLEGTRILTQRGEVAVEELHIGDHAVAMISGGLLPIRWIGHRRVEPRRHPKPHDVHPVRIAAGAFADRRPHRDLWVTPGHRVLVDGVLVHIDKLINDASIVQVEMDSVSTWHVELEQHDVLLAEGLPAESFLDVGNRRAFTDVNVVALHPDILAAELAPHDEDDTCVQVIGPGPQLTAIQARLLQRAIDVLGHKLTDDPDLHVIADGHRVAAATSDGLHVFRLPSGARDVRLVSRVRVPSRMEPGWHDTRRLGVAVSCIVVDGTHDVPLDWAGLEDGWHRPERDGGGLFRWTDGAARLPAGGETIGVELVHARRYWADRPGDVAVLFG